MHSVVADYRSVGVAGSLAGGRVTTGSRHRDTAARDTRGSTPNSAAAAVVAKPLLPACLLYAVAAAAVAARTVTTCRFVSIPRRRRLL